MISKIHHGHGQDVPNEGTEAGDKARTTTHPERLVRAKRALPYPLPEYGTLGIRCYSINFARTMMTTKSQGTCETTLTERFEIDCRCGTYGI